MDLVLNFKVFNFTGFLILTDIHHWFWVLSLIV